MVIYHPDTIQSTMNGALIISSRTGKGLGIKTGNNPACYGQAAWKEIKVRPSTDSIDTLLHSSYGTSATNQLRSSRQSLDSRSWYVTQQTVYLTKTNTLAVFSTRTTTTPTSLDETLTELLKLQKPTRTLHLLLQRLYPTSRALLRPSRGFYNLTISV